MGGVDLIDRYISLYRIKSKTYKWTFRAIMHFIDLSICQAWILYRLNMKSKGQSSVDLLHFKLTMAEKLLLGTDGDNESSSDDDDNSNDERGPVNLPPIELRTRKAEHMPMYVESRNPMRCRREGCNKKIRFKCSTCNVMLCFNPKNNGFKEFHRP